MNEEMARLLGIDTQQAQNEALNRAFLGGLLQVAALSGKQRQPVSTAPALAQAVLGGMQTYESSMDKTLKDALTNLQVKNLLQKQQEQQRMREAIRSAYTTRPVAGLGLGAEQLKYMQPEIEAFGAEGIAPAAATVAPTERVVDRSKLLSAIAEFAPEKYLELTQTKPADLPSSVREYQFAVGQGYEGSYQDFIAQQKKAGAPTTTVEVKTGEGIAKEIGPMLEKSQVAASGAVVQIDAADRIINAVDTGKVLSGPGTQPAVRALQIGNILGVTGKNSNEIVANTRQVVRGLAELTLQGRKLMRGEGAITVDESKLAERAVSGDITDLTNEEIKLLANASKRAAQFTIQQHDKKLDVLRKDPAMSNLVPFFEVSTLPAPQQTGLPSGVTVRRKP